MIGRFLLSHFDRVKIAVTALNPSNAFVFGAACAERQWSVYERASANKTWARREVLRSNLDAIWDWLEDREKEPLISAKACESAIFDESEDLRDDLGFQVANSFFGLVSLVEENNPSQVYLAAQGNLDLIDAFLYEILDLSVTAENDRAVDNHALMQAEMERQLEDLTLLAAPGAPAPVTQVRLRAAGIDLLEGWWPR